jgi:hypothetical protein
MASTPGEGNFTITFDRDGSYSVDVPADFGPEDWGVVDKVTAVIREFSREVRSRSA